MINDPKRQRADKRTVGLMFQQYTNGISRTKKATMRDNNIKMSVYKGEGSEKSTLIPVMPVMIALKKIKSGLF